jgi:hypothetical protein
LNWRRKYQCRPSFVMFVGFSGFSEARAMQHAKVSQCICLSHSGTVRVNEGTMQAYHVEGY